MRSDNKKYKDIMNKLAWFIHRYLLMLAISLSSLIFLTWHIVSPLEDDKPLIPIMLFFIWISLFLMVIYKSLEENSEKIVGKISNLIDQKTHADFSNKIVNSRFEFDKMVCSATKSILLVGPNLHFLTKNSEETMQILFQKFNNNPNFEFHMLISDPELISKSKAKESESNKLKYNAEDIFKVVSEFSFGDNNFEDQLKNGIKIFKGWCKCFEGKKYLFGWEKVPGKDSGRLTEFLMQNFNIEWIKAAKINKIDDDKTIMITNDTNFLSLKLNTDKNNVNIEIDDGRTDKFIVKTENGELNIYGKNEKSEIKGDFEIRKNGIITISLIFIDADTKNGKALIIPVPRGISGSERPCFLINYLQHESAFTEYYIAYRRLFAEGNKLS